MTTPRPLEFPPSLQVPGSQSADWGPVAVLAELAPGALLRVTRGDLDLLLVHTPAGLVAIDDRCPHMAAPLSIGSLDGCVIACPLHKGRFDLATGEVVVFPTTGGLDADGSTHPTWSPPGSEPKPEPSDLKAQARALTRVRRVRYYPVRIVGELIEVAIPA